MKWVVKTGFAKENVEISSLHRHRKVPTWHMSPRYQCSLCSLFGFNLEDQLGVRAQFPMKVLVHSFWKSILEGIRLKWNRKNQTSPPTYKFSWIVHTRCWTTTPVCFFGNMKRGDNSHLIWGKKFGTVGTMHFRVLPGEQHLEPQIIKIIVPWFVVVFFSLPLFHQLLDILVSAQKRVACPSREVLEKNHAELDPKKHENEIERNSEIAASSAAGITTNQYLDEY